MIETTHLPVVDVHCHPFIDHGQLTVEQYIDIVSFPGAGVDFLLEGEVDPATAKAQVQNVRHNTVYFRYFVRQMATYFGCEPTIEAIVAARNAAIHDFSGYVQHLYNTCNLTTMVTDFGYPTPPMDVSQFKQASPINVVPLYRIETFIDEWQNKDVDWAEFSRGYDETISTALGQAGFMGLKSVIAYRTGLNVSPLSRSPDQGMQAWAALRRCG